MLPITLRETLLCSPNWTCYILKANSIKPFRYPVVLRSFQLNPGSGGQGLYKGGDGVIRELVFRRPLTLSILSERRAFCPYGLKGMM